MVAYKINLSPFFVQLPDVGTLEQEFTPAADYLNFEYVTDTGFAEVNPYRWRMMTEGLYRVQVLMILLLIGNGGATRAN